MFKFLRKGKEKSTFFVFRLVKLVTVIVNPSYLKALMKGSVAAIEHEHLGKIGTVSSVIDAGANKGQFALVSRKLWPNCKVYSFEPLEKPSKVFSAVFSDDDNVHLFRNALGSDNKEATMHISASMDSSSILSITDRQQDVFPGTHEVGSVKVKVAPLHHTITSEDVIRPSLMKIDVQGYEMEVLVGSQKLFSCLDYIYVELSFVELYAGQPLVSEVLEYLSKNNFGLVGVYNLNYDIYGNPVQGDWLFMNGHKNI